MSTKQTRRRFSGEFKFKVVVEALKERHSLAELSQKYEVSQVMISRWKSEFLEAGPLVFTKAKSEDTKTLEAANEKLYTEIGRQKIEIDFLKKSLCEAGEMKARARFVKPAWTISVRRQCELLTVNRGQLYYAPKEERPENLEMMRLMDKHLIDHPTEGVLSMVAFLRDYNFHVNPKRIRRLFGLMGYQAIYPRKNLSKLGMAEFIKPYLLRGLKITRPNQVWCTDITYIPMRRGFLYLTAIMDVYSRKILAWGISNTLEAAWCVRVLEEAIDRYGCPEIINSDQGSQSPHMHGPLFLRRRTLGSLWTGRDVPPTTLGLSVSGGPSRRTTCT